MKKLSQLVSTILNLNAKSKLAAFLVIFAVLGTTVFQNCAKGKFNLSPEQVQQLAQAYCQGGVTTSCSNETGTGLQCSVANTEAAAGVCVFQSCNPGYRLVGNLCTPSACTPNSVASCTYTVEDNVRGLVATKLVSPSVMSRLSPVEEVVALGQGTMTCNSEGTGYGQCTPVICSSVAEDDRMLKLGGVVTRAIEETPSSSSSSPFPSPSIPFPSSSSPSPSVSSSSPSPSPSSSSPSPSPTPSPSPSIVEFCKYSCAQGAEICARTQQVVTSVAFEPVCTEGATSYFTMCRATGCAPGYSQVDFPGGSFSCRAQTCTPGATAPCTDGPGHGTATCDTLGLEYGSCQLTSCDEGYTFTNGVCELNNTACTPGQTGADCGDINSFGNLVCGADNAYACVITGCAGGFDLIGEGTNAYCEIQPTDFIDKIKPRK